MHGRGDSQSSSGDATVNQRGTRDLHSSSSTTSNKLIVAGTCLHGLPEKWCRGNGGGRHGKARQGEKPAKSWHLQVEGGKQASELQNIVVTYIGREGETNALATYHTSNLVSRSKTVVLSHSLSRHPFILQTRDKENRNSPHNGKARGHF